MAVPQTNNDRPIRRNLANDAVDFTNVISSAWLELPGTLNRQSPWQASQARGLLAQDIGL